FALAQCNSFAAWLMMAAIRHPDGGEIRSYADLGVDVVTGDNSHFKIVLQMADDEDSDDETEEETAPFETQEIPQAKPDSDIMAQIEARLQYKYPYDELIGVPTKVTASELTKQEHSGDSISLMRPSFMMRGGLTPTERGKALHKYMEFANFRAAAEKPEYELERLQKSGFISEIEAAAVDIDKVKIFFDTMKPMLDSADKIMREQEFSVKLDAEHARLVTDVDTDESIVLEGECDCVLVYNDSSVIIDYKTDRISAPDRLVEHYATQLRLYRYAMEQVLSKPVSKIYLYSFYLDKLIEVQ
ncbi:MAG: PD-(D/E)XK nuclease family protein, partial [Acutalibacteraceae bacterium]